MSDRLNLEIAARLEEVAELLVEQGANRFRVEAYRRAARMLRGLPRSLSEIVEEEGMEGLQKLYGVGESLARSIFMLVTTGTLPMLQRLRGESDPVALLCTVPGIGRKLAERIHDDLGIETLEELEAAANDGRLEDVEGLSGKRLTGVRDSLSARLARVKHGADSAGVLPSVEEILDVDEEYRSKVSRDALPRITPRRFNPDREAWLPVLHTQRGERHYTALFSNTALAHRLQRTRDWVVIYWEGAQESQCTVVTEYRGALEGLRIIRGREAECEAHYLAPATRHAV